MKCPLCEEGKKLDPEFQGEGIGTMRMNLHNLFGTKLEDDGIQIQDTNVLMWDNSSGEYAKLGIVINFCPICGRRIRAKESSKAW